MARSIDLRHWADPHDLLVLHDTRLLLYSTTSPPPWVTLALQRAPMVVVRRAPASGDLLPVGIRGPSRSQRCAAYLRIMSQGIRRIPPEQLVTTQDRMRNQRWRLIKAIQALSELAPWLQATELCWGPTGSVGFELASGVPTATTSSDLDLLVRAPQPLSWEMAKALHAHLAKVSVHTDVQIETPCGAFALAEYVQRWPGSQASILLRTTNGLKLVRNPWESTSHMYCPKDTYQARAGL
ncbi:malonate decarboxylase holo-ACP synthase [Ktedonospora formicarum]|uniref:malonate decarboxylase holo-ACP synthase n=1 Tax=Ktedonospora formicarum TaxID=2778364 RepID=UPI001C68757C|nr:malonate decarboxylase holo-ACP synthase [Ktedonospora formicarum]